MSDEKYHVVCFMRVEPEDSEPMTHAEAEDEIKQARLMQPENVYVIERIYGPE